MIKFHCFLGGVSLFLIVLTFNISLVSTQVHGTGELNQNCNKTSDCRKDAYICKTTCICADHYRENSGDATCEGAIGQKCEIDPHCVKGGICSDKKVCICKEGTPAEDNWSCKNAAEFTKPFVLTLVSSLFILLLSK